MFKQAIVPLLVFTGAMAWTTNARAQDDREQVSRGVEAALLDLGARDALGEIDTPLTIRKPAQVRYELGAVVDAASSGSGLQVLAVTPGGAAERIGLRTGDRLLAINGVRLAGIADTSAVLDRTMQNSGGRVRLQVSRGGDAVRLSGAADVAAIPAYELTIGAEPVAGRCGYVADELGATPRNRGIYEALIVRIDGRGTPVTFRPNRYRLEAGRHVLLVGEVITDYYKFTPLEQKRRRQVRSRSTIDELYKPLVVDVEPGVSYRIGVELLEDRVDLEGIRNQAYWRPVVYNMVETQCD